MKHSSVLAFAICALTLCACGQKYKIDVKNGSSNTPDASGEQPVAGDPSSPVEPNKIPDGDVKKCDPGIYTTCVEAKVTVDPLYNPFLSGMPDKWVSKAEDGHVEDVANLYAREVIVRADFISGGARLEFEVSGQTNNEHSNPGYNFGPDGDSGTFERSTGSGTVVLEENGISTLKAPKNSLIGIYLANDRPDSSAAPVIDDAGCPRDFSTEDSRNRGEYHPKLKQAFFIGDGQNATGVRQIFVAPPGATRLYLANQDAFEWNNNWGQFKVTVRSRK